MEVDHITFWHEGGKTTAANMEKKKLSRLVKFKLIS